MVTELSKSERAATFRARLAQAMATRRVSKSALARQAGFDRSTLSQLLGGDPDRLPNGQLLAALATALGVTTDWLLGLADQPEPVANLMAAAVTLTEAPRALIDETIIAWHREAAGYKIRHVPATLPDMLKTKAVIEWEYSPHPGRTVDQAIGAAEDNLAWMRSARSDYEIALPDQELEAFARGEGYWRGLPADIRRQQLDQLARLYDQLYPSLRIYLFDARRVFSAPLTVFGPLMAAVYLGRNYVLFRDRARIDAVSAHFDWLVREAAVGARDFPARVRDLLALAV